MYNYIKLDDDKIKKISNKKISKKKILKMYNFSMPIRFLILCNAIDFKKCGIKTI